MIQVRKSADRGYADHGWLKTFHTFSFAGYHDPDFMGFRALRVINDDVVDPGAGFPTHPHRDMEILTYVVDGALEHRDSMGTGSIIRPGDIQRMSAGSGVTHSEFNHSKATPTRLLQIWIEPAELGTEPSYEQRHFDESERSGRLRLVASTDGRDGSIRIGQDVAVYAGLLGEDDRTRVEINDGRQAWVQVVNGELSVGGERLSRGDGAALIDESGIDLASTSNAEFLVFDLA